MKTILILVILFVGFNAHAQKKDFWKRQGKYDTVLVIFHMNDLNRIERGYQLFEKVTHAKDSLVPENRSARIPTNIFLDANKKRVSKKLSEKIDPEIVK